MNFREGPIYFNLQRADVQVLLLRELSNLNLLLFACVPSLCPGLGVYGIHVHVCMAHTFEKLPRSR